MKKLRTHYALCIGTLPILECDQIKKTLSKSQGCNVEFILRPRANGKFAIYVRIKRSLERAIKLAEVRDKMLSVVDQRNR